MSCSSSLVKQTLSTDQRISHINLLGVRFFRPVYDVPDSDDYSLKNQELDCQTPDLLWASLVKPEAVISALSCINGLGKSKEEVVNYEYRAQAQPLLEIKSDSKTCLAQVIPRIDLPREIYFLGKKAEADSQDTFAFSFNTKVGRIADFKIPFRKHQVQFRFPLSRELKSEKDLVIWLTTNVLSLFNEKGEFRASVVPEEVANRCFKGDPLFQAKKAGKIAPVFWP